MFDVIARNFPYLMGGLWVTVKLSVFALAGGIFLGMLAGLARLSKNPWIYYPVTAYVNFLRNIPLILVIFWFYFIMPLLVGEAMDPFWAAVVSFIMFEATYFGEIFRAGYQTISKDLINASYSTGMTYFQTARHISIPIAMRRMLPSLITQSIVTFQDTSLAFVIGLPELVRRASIVDNLEVRSIELFGFAALVYFIVCFVGSRISRYYEELGRKANII
ncbi:amino acid ABC transporter permease [Dethiosulfatarculus sandiegensis]|uniref:Glutamate/aspartate import permease protein GltK n=1 Tax=Dethiosulfatarculus sandiegensis TaxID=1429043 RepID=A0A0D2J3K5_9BACT|nr:amino acid ABC transporter permease [Dethiosulfatarculus sandiegensis]KIX12779.1 glutamate/aspartate transporter permease GltK [Dethiosulfatarculus sandiegensis]